MNIHEQGKYAEAIAAYAGADPAAAATHRSMGRAYYAAGAAQEALQAYEKAYAAAQGTQRVDVALDLAKVAVGLGNAAVGAQYLALALELSPTYEPALAARLAFCMQVQDAAGAEAAADALAAIGLRSTASTELLASYRAALGADAQALRTLQVWLGGRAREMGMRL